jgi:hypothetical protein
MKVGTKPVSRNGGLSAGFCSSNRGEAVLSPWLAGKQKPENEHTVELRIVEGGSVQALSSRRAPCWKIFDKARPGVNLIMTS